MYVPPLHPTCNFDSYISGEVMIDPSAAIAPGVLLQASPNSQIIIGAGVCIGMGSIIHAYEGTIEVEVGAILGAGVLLIGKGKIGANACIGSTTTILNRSIEPQHLVAAGSVIGDESRQVVATPAGATIGVAGESAPALSANAQSQTTVAATANGETAESLTDSSSVQTTSEPTKSASEASEATGSQVYGQDRLNRMLSTMFPHRQSLNRPHQGGQSPNKT